MFQVKEIILLADFNKTLLNDYKDVEWKTFTTSLGFSQLVCDPTRVTETSSTLNINRSYLYKSWWKCFTRTCL